MNNDRTQVANRHLQHAVHFWYALLQVRLHYIEFHSTAMQCTVQVHYVAYIRNTVNTSIYRTGPIITM